MKQKFLIAMGFALITNLSIAQDKWDTDGNIGVGNNAKFGPKNNKGFSIITDNQPAVNVASDGTFNFIKPVNFTNKVKFDSLRILSYLDVDSIHCRTIKVGNSWTINDAGPSYAGTRPFNQQTQNATDRNHVFEGGAFFQIAASRDNVKAIVGYLSSANGAFHRLNLHSEFANPVFTSFSNRTLYGGINSFVATDGFKVGILANGVAQINQQENLDMQFLTNNAQRAVIKANGFVGINTNLPGNQMEINSQLASAATANGGPVAPTFGPPTGASGLRFSDLNSTSIPQNNTSGKVLSVNAAGDVVLVPDGGTSGPAIVTAQNGLNTSVASPAVELGGTLIRNTFIDQGIFNTVWGGNAGGQFGLGTNFFNANTSSFIQGASLEILDNARGTSMYVKNNTSGGSAGIVMDVLGAGLTNYGQIINVNSAQNNIGIYTQETGSLGSTVTEGIVSLADFGANVYGGVFQGTADANTTDAFGLTSSLILSTGSSNVTKGAGLSGLVKGNTPTTKYGVVGVTHNNNNNGNVAIAGIVGGNGFISPNFASPANIAVYGGFVGPNFSNAAPTNFGGYFEGDVFINGPSMATGLAMTTSDQQFKTNVDSISDATAIIKQLKPRTFYYDTTNIYGLNFSSKKQHGLIAQDVMTVLPELVGTAKTLGKKDTLGNIIEQSISYKTLNYNALFAIMLKGMQEQQKRIDSLVIAQSNARVINPNLTLTNPATNATNLNKQNITLSNADALVLDQNQPNPFSESTVIKYNVPEKYGYAQLIFTTIEGRILKTIDIAKKGAGEITVYANDLSNGIYTYTLVVDGKTVDTKKMIKQN